MRTTRGCGGPGWNSSCLPVVMGCVPFIIDREVRDLPQMALERHCVLFTLVNMRLRARQEVGKTGRCVRPYNSYQHALTRPAGGRKNRLRRVRPYNSYQHALTRPAGGRKNRPLCAALQFASTCAYAPGRRSEKQVALCAALQFVSTCAYAPGRRSEKQVTLCAALQFVSTCAYAPGQHRKKELIYLYNSAVLGFMAP